MFYYIHQLHTPSFPIGLVKIKSDFIVRLVEVGLGGWILVVAVISVDAYPFFGFLRTDLSPWGYKNRCFLIALLPGSNETELGSSENTAIVLVLCHAWKCVPTAIFSGVDISEVPGCHLL